MNPLGIFAIIVALVVGYYGLSGSDFSILNLFKGPVVTAPGPGAEIENPQPISGSAREESVQRRSGESPYKGKVRIAEIQRSGRSPDEEIVVIRYSGGFFGSASQPDALVDVTGWRLASRLTSGLIPRAFNIPEIDASEQDIFLASGGEVIILMGTPNYSRNFRENQCVGYFNQSYSFAPSLSDSCADSDPDLSRLLRFGFSGACIEAIGAVPSCRTPQGPFQAGVIGSACIDYMNQNFSYAGCVKNFRDRRDFLRDTWRVSLRRSTKMFDPQHDRVILRDRDGLLVDEFEY